MTYQLVPREKQVEALLHSMHLTHRYKGYQYIKEILERALLGKGVDRHTISLLAQERGEDPQNVERCISAAPARAEQLDPKIFGRVTMKTSGDNWPNSTVQKIYNMGIWLFTHEPLVPTDRIGPIRWCVRE